MFCFYYDCKQLSIKYCPKKYRQYNTLYSFDSSYFEDMNEIIKIVNENLINQRTFYLRTAEILHLDKNFNMILNNLYLILNYDLYENIRVQIVDFLFKYRNVNASSCYTTNYFDEFKNFCDVETYNLFYSSYFILN